MTNEHARDFEVWVARNDYRDDDAMRFVSVVPLVRYNEPPKDIDAERFQGSLTDRYNRHFAVFSGDMERYPDYRFASPVSERPTHKLTVGKVVEGLVRWAVRELIKKVDGR